MRIATGDITLSRKVVLDELARTKKRLMDAIESGDRDFAKVRNIFNAYTDLQTGADALGHTCTIQDSA